MGEESTNPAGKARLALRLGLVLSFLFALTWSLPSIFNWIFFWTAAYCFFLSWYYQPRAVRVHREEPFEFRTSNERAAMVVKKIVRIVWISGLSLFLFFLVIGIFSGPETQTQEQDDTRVVSGEYSTDEATSWNEKGYEFYLNKDYDSALFCYERTLRLEPGNANAWYSKGLVYYDQKQMDRALEAFSRAYDAGMRDAFLSHVLGYLNDTNGNTSRAIGYYKEALSLDSSRTDIYTRLAELEPEYASKYKALEERWKN